jgi:hypothetical protein
MNAPLPKAAALDTIDLELGGARLIIPTRAIAKAMLERLLAGSVQAGASAPRIGEKWDAEGGIYAGTVRGLNGVPYDYHLIVHEEERDSIKWQDALDWAKGLSREDHKFGLPTRREQAVLFGNVPELFQKEWYWSGERLAEHSEYAWMQGFDFGSQGYGDQGNESRARAVRRVPIQ